VLWYPTQAKTGLEWGTQPFLPVSDLDDPFLCEGFLAALVSLRLISRFIPVNTIPQQCGYESRKRFTLPQGVFFSSGKPSKAAEL
jgi:hypothetical protein